ncbi:MAG: hypothetical protein ACTSWQ_03990 [Candidatus Thorarchaeota archaeon]
MKVLIDGKEINVQNDVRIIQNGIIYGMSVDDETDLEGHLEVVLTGEGIVSDVYNRDGEPIGTMSQTYGELADEILE